MTQSEMPRTGLRNLAAAVLLVLPLALSACSGDGEPEYVERPPEDLYNEAYTAMQSEDYVDAARLFDEVERQHP